MTCVFALKSRERELTVRGCVIAFPRKTKIDLYQNRQHLLGCQPSGYLTYKCESVFNFVVLIIANN